MTQTLDAPHGDDAQAAIAQTLENHRRYMARLGPDAADGKPAGAAGQWWRTSSPAVGGGGTHPDPVDLAAAQVGLPGPQRLAMVKQTAAVMRALTESAGREGQYVQAQRQARQAGGQPQPAQPGLAAPTLA